MLIEITINCLFDPQVVLGKGVLKITLRHGYSPVNLLHIFRTLFLKNTFGWLLLDLESQSSKYDYLITLGNFNKEPTEIAKRNFKEI